VTDEFDTHDSDSGPESSEATAAVGEIKQLLKLDSEFFIEFFLATELTSEVPQFHKEIWGLLTSTAMERVLLAIPRDHAKTTLAKLCVVWYWLFTHHRFCAYLSNTSPIAKNACRDIIQYMRSPNFEQVYGPIKMLKETESEGLWIFELNMGGGKLKKCILRSVGAGQQMRGINIDNQRPDITVIDDVEDNDNTDSETQQKKLDKWMFGPYLKALARKKKIIWLGNMLQKTSLLARLSAMPRWNPVVFGALVVDSESGEMQPLWPERWPVEELRADFKEYKDLGLIETWLCEMMNMPGHGENGFTEENLHYDIVPTPGGNNIRGAFLTLDPAFGLETTNDMSAICVHVIQEDGPPMVVEYVHARHSEVELFEHMLRLAYKWNAWTWGIEAIAAQKVLITLFNVLLASKLLAGRVQMIPLMAGKGDPKIGRIRAWVSMMTKKEYAIPEYDMEITSQLLNYNTKTKNNKDDLIDSCAYGPQMLAQFEALIIETFNGSHYTDSTSQHGTAVADV
jgi:hypothetical protein